MVPNMEMVAWGAFGPRPQPAVMNPLPLLFLHAAWIVFIPKSASKSVLALCHFHTHFFPSHIGIQSLGSSSAQSPLIPFNNGKLPSLPLAVSQRPIVPPSPCCAAPQRRRPQHPYVSHLPPTLLCPPLFLCAFCPPRDDLHCSRCCDRAGLLPAPFPPLPAPPPICSLVSAERTRIAPQPWDAALLLLLLLLLIIIISAPGGVLHPIPLSPVPLFSFRRVPPRDFVWRQAAQPPCLAFRPYTTNTSRPSRARAAGKTLACLERAIAPRARTALHIWLHH